MDNIEIYNKIQSRSLNQMMIDNASGNPERAGRQGNRKYLYILKYYPYIKITHRDFDRIQDEIVTTRVRELSNCIKQLDTMFKSGMIDTVTGYIERKRILEREHDEVEMW